MTASSAGTRAMVAQPIHPHAALVLERLGGDSRNFQARQFSSAFLQNVDLILTMTRAHRDHVLEQAPHRVRSTFTLAEAAQMLCDFTAEHINDLVALRPNIDARAIQDIPDPIGQDLEFFRTVGDRIKTLLPPILEFCGRI